MKRLYPFILGALAAACAQDNSVGPLANAPDPLAAVAGSSASRRVVFGIDESNTLVSFRPNAPQQLLSVIGITGLPAGERILEIDFRPADGTLYGLGAASRLYRLDPSTGAATALGVSAFAPALSGRMFGLDFNPTVDRVRLHSDAEQNLRLDPNTGAVAAMDGALAYEAADVSAGVDPSIVGSAYTNSALNNGTPPLTTVLYGIDQVTRTLVVSPSPNGGTLRTVGALGVTFGRAVGFDIATSDNVALASLNTGTTQTGLYRINLTTGAATRVGDIGHRERIIAISVRPE